MYCPRERLFKYFVKDSFLFFCVFVSFFGQTLTKLRFFWFLFSFQLILAENDNYHLLDNFYLLK